MNNKNELERTHDEILGFSDRLHQSGCAPYSVSEYTKLYAKNRNVDISIDVTPTKVITVFEKTHSKRGNRNQKTTFCKPA